MIDVTHDRDDRRTRDLLALRFTHVRDQLALGVVGIGTHRNVAEFFDGQRRGVVIDRLGDGRHDAHLEQRLDHVAALHRELLREVGHGDRVADRDFALHRRGRTFEAVRATAAARRGAAATLRAATLRLAARVAGAATGAIGGTEVQLAGEARGLVVVLDATDHRVRTAVALLGAGGRIAIVGTRRRGRLVAVTMRCRSAADRLGSFRRRRRRGGRGSLLAQALGFRFGLALALQSLFGATPVVLGQTLLFRQVLLARRLELAQDLGALGFRIDRATLTGAQRDLLAHDDIDRLAVLAATDRQFLLAASAERDLLRRGDFLDRGIALAVCALEEAEQLELLGTGDDLVGIAERHARFGQLFEQFLDRRIHQCGQLTDGGLLRHS